MPGKQSTSELLEQILRIRRAERSGKEDLRELLVDLREFLEEMAGPTVKQAEAARLLGVSRPALSRWIENGEISTVLTPQGRREIPLSELVDLLLDVQELRGDVPRPLSEVIKARRRSANAIDLDQVVPRGKRGHRMAERQSLAYHRLIASRLSDRMVVDARRRIQKERDRNLIHPRWADEWDRVLALPLERIGKAIAADTPRARELRQTSPFAGLLTEQERRRLVRAVEERGAA
jgi:excisionase family DNA binding protein